MLALSLAVVKQWQARRDLNPQPPDLESGALPLELLACMLKNGPSNGKDFTEVENP